MDLCGWRVGSTRRLRWQTLQTLAIKRCGLPPPLDDEGVVRIHGDEGDEGGEDVDCFGDGPRGPESPVGVDTL